MRPKASDLAGRDLLLLVLHLRDLDRDVLLLAVAHDDDRDFPIFSRDSVGLGGLLHVVAVEADDHVTT